MPYENLLKGRHSLPQHAYCITTVTLGRRPLFLDFATARLVVSEMKRLHEDGVVNSLAWVVMPDHVHWLFSLGNTFTLPRAIRQFKGISARSINRHLLEQGAIWQKSYYDRAVRSDEDLRILARYVVGNPLRAGLVQEIGQYPLWDAAWL